MSQFKCRERKQQHAITSIVITKDERLVLVGTLGGVVNLYNVIAFQYIRSFKHADSSSITDMMISECDSSFIYNN